MPSLISSSTAEAISKITSPYGLLGILALLVLGGFCYFFSDKQHRGRVMSAYVLFCLVIIAVIVVLNKEKEPQSKADRVPTKAATPAPQQEPSTPPPSQSTPTKSETPQQKAAKPQHRKESAQPTPQPQPDVVCKEFQQGVCVNYGTVNIGKRTPPPRKISATNMLAAAAMLKDVPKGSTVSIEVVGEDDEVKSFADQIRSLFLSTEGVWDMVGYIPVGTLVQSWGPTSKIQTHGEGFHCQFGRSGTSAEKTTLKALALTGYTCEPRPSVEKVWMQTGLPPVGENTPIELQIVIGTRLLPE